MHYFFVSFLSTYKMVHPIWALSKKIEDFLAKKKKDSCERVGLRLLHSRSAPTVSSHGLRARRRQLSLTNPDSYTYEENKLGHERSRWPQHRQASMTHRYILLLKEKIKCITICITGSILMHMSMS